MSDQTEPTPAVEQEEEPFRLSNHPPKHKKPGRKRTMISAADLALLEVVVHREEYTRRELAAKFGLSLKQLQNLITHNGWLKREGDEEAEDCDPLPNPDPSVFIPCRYPPGHEGKIWMLQERFAKRLPLWHPKDRGEKMPKQSGNLL